MKILIAKRGLPTELILVVNGCCYEIKDVVVGYDYSSFTPGTQVPLSDLPTKTEQRLVVEDDLGVETWYDPEQWVVVPFDAKVFQALRNDPTRYIVQGDALVENPNWQSPIVTVPDPPTENAGGYEAVERLPPDTPGEDTAFKLLMSGQLRKVVTEKMKRIKDQAR